jgi:dihydrofolate synthase/folylpolyglutamate synthase
MTYQHTIDHLYTRLPMFSRIGSAAYKEDLHNTIALCSALNDPQKKFKSIHIAGTNGKGSTSHMLAAILQQAGYKTGLYTSPHLKDFGERIKINGRMVKEDFVIEFTERTKKLCDEIEPSFFELTVAMAYTYFAEEEVDIAVVETGLGGRLDSTNIITPILSIITNIGYDHMNILGNSLQEIAAEKAGIIKRNIPVVIGEYLEETKPIFINKAKEMNAPIYFAQEQFKTYEPKITNYNLQVDVEDNLNKHRETFTLDLNGTYQVKNLLSVLSAESIISKQGFKITNEAEKFAFANVKKLTGLHGRWDVISEHPTIVLDVAHNEDGIKQIINSTSRIAGSKIHFVIGLVKDKEVDKVLMLLPKDANYYFTNAHIPRALPSAELKAKANIAGLNGNIFDNVNDAIKTAKQNAASDGLVIVCGSVFLIGEVDQY